MSRRLRLVDPRPELSGCQFGKRQEQIPEIPLRVDGNDRDPVNSGFLDQRDPQTGLTAPGHAHAHRVGRQVTRVIQDRVGPGLAEIEIVPVTEKNRPSCS